MQRLLFTSLLFVVTVAAQYATTSPSKVRVGEYHGKELNEVSIGEGRIVLTDNRQVPNWVRNRPTCGYPMNVGQGGFAVRLPPNEAKPHQLCSAEIAVPGYRTRTIPFAARMEVRLSPLNPGEGSTLSSTSIRTSAAARKNFWLAKDLQRKGETAQAIECSKKAVEIEPQFAEAWNQLGWEFEQAGTIIEAESAYQKALGLDPVFIEPRVRLAGLALAQSRWLQAQDESAKAIAMNAVEYPISYLYRSLAELNLNQWDAAERDAREALPANADHSMDLAEYVLAAALDQEGDSEQALEHFRRYIVLVPKGGRSAAAKNRIAQLQQTLHQ